MISGLGLVVVAAGLVDPAAQRYQRAVQVAWGALCVLAAAVPRNHRGLVASLGAVVATVELGLAGVLAGLSLLTKRSPWSRSRY